MASSICKMIDFSRKKFKTESTWRYHWTYPFDKCLYLLVITDEVPYNSHFLKKGAVFTLASIPSLIFSHILGTPKNIVGLTALKFSIKLPCKKNNNIFRTSVTKNFNCYVSRTDINLRNRFLQKNTIVTLFNAIRQALSNPTSFNTQV